MAKKQTKRVKIPTKPSKKKFNWKQPQTWQLAPFATLGPIGYFPKGSGTIGSLVALPLAYLASSLGIYWLWAVTLCVFLLGLRAVGQFTADSKEKDPGCVIVDEVAGQLVAFWVVLPQFMHWPILLIGFVLFRFFDICKFGPVAFWDRRKKPLGVMMDDIMAGAFSGFILAVLQVMAISNIK